MASILDTNNRIKSIESTLKITSAMKLVATAKLRNAKLAFDHSRDYARAVTNIIESLSNGLDAAKYTEVRDEGKDCFIMIGSEIGLCGGYNSNMFKLVEDRTDAYFAALGKKAVAHYEHRPEYNVIYSSIDVSDKPDIHKTNELGNLVFEMYNNKEIKSLSVIYTKYINSVQYETSTLQIFPLKKRLDTTIVEYEPSGQQLLSIGLPRYVDAMIFVAMRESLVSEYASRRMAMENATDNANDLINNLIVKRNRARQAAITQEISEIVGGSEAL